MTKPNATSPVPSPKGTRDFYPDQMLRQNYITRLWRDTAIRHGFEEINGPTFEMLELYTRKSGEGIVSELFRFRREGGEDDYALRPEFTPTLARMYAAKAASLPSPTKWFSIGPYFRAEKPQRGRLREFLQWNVDVLGGEDAATRASFDGDTMAVIAGALDSAGIGAPQTQIKINSRPFIETHLRMRGVAQSDIPRAFALIDRKSKMSDEQFRAEADSLGFKADAFFERAQNFTFFTLLGNMKVLTEAGDELGTVNLRESLGVVASECNLRVGSNWFDVDPTIVRGLAYYTGTVFEVIAEGERAIAGGGRYDNLIELFGGPPTPAVGFGMGDVVLGLLLDDKGLMPQGVELLDALSRPGASLRPEAFVVAGSEDEDALVEPLLANLRRGVERDGFDGKSWAADRYAVRPMHARRTYKTTRNLKKLISDAEKQHAKFAVVLHGPDKVQVKDLDRREELVHDQRGDFSVNPASGAYVGQAIAARLGH